MGFPVSLQLDALQAILLYRLQQVTSCDEISAIDAVGRLY